MNQKFNNKKFMLVKVKYTAGQPANYTYAALVKQNIQTGDHVVVMVGNGTGVDSMKVAEVGATTSDMKHLPKEYEIKPIVCKVDKTYYDKVMKYLG